MTKSKIFNSTIVLAALALGACGSQEADIEHLEEGQPGVETMAATWGMGGIPVPPKFTVRPGDEVSRYTETCELDYDPEHLVGPYTCRDRAERECSDDGGLPLPGALIRYTHDCGEDGCVTVTIKCKFSASDS